MNTAPKYIANHPAVAHYATGVSQSSDYRHYVELRDGWQFTGGRHEGSTSAFFNSKADLEHADPQPVVVAKPKPKQTPRKRVRTARVQMMILPERMDMLKELAEDADRSMTWVFEDLIRREHERKYGS